MYTGPRVGFIGVGHLGTALLRGVLRAGSVPPESIRICDPAAGTLGGFPQIPAAADAADVVRQCGLIFLCVRPDAASGVLAGLEARGKVILSSVAGLDAETIQEKTGAHVLRIMPNLAAALDEAAVAYADPNDLTAAQLTAALDVLRPLGTAVPVSEDNFDTVTGLSGSGPAYAYLLLEGLIAGACRLGLPEHAARLLAAQTLKGAAAIVLSTDESLEDLINGVATPGGTTEAGLRVLEDGNFAEHAAWAVDAAASRAAQLTGPADRPENSRGNCTKLFAKYKFCE